MLIPVGDSSRIAEVRRTAAKLGQRAGMDAESVGRMSITATELASNILKHAGAGEIAIRNFEDAEGRGIEILALDRGNGISDVRRALTDGYSTAGSAGTGLGAIQRLSDVFALFSRPSQGTVLVSRFRASNAPEKPFVVGAVDSICPGEAISGDAWSIVQNGHVANIMIIDGSGHGPVAAEAAILGVAKFEQARRNSVEDTIASLHASLRPTRGAAVAVANVDLTLGEARYCGIGNVSTRIADRERARNLVSTPGVAGHGNPKIRTFKLEFARSSVMVLHTDGISTRWDLNSYPGLFSSHPAVIAGVLARDYRRERDDATVLVVRPLK